jgi:hypothetical protein
MSLAFGMKDRSSGCRDGGKQAAVLFRLVTFYICSFEGVLFVVPKRSPDPARSNREQRSATQAVNPHSLAAESAHSPAASGAV